MRSELSMDKSLSSINHLLVELGGSYNTKFVLVSNF